MGLSPPPALTLASFHSRRPQSLGSALRVGHEQVRDVVLRDTLGSRVPLRRSPRRGVSVPRSGSRPPVRADAPHPAALAPRDFLVFQPRVRWHASCFHSPFTMQAIETELETAEFEALWLQARCYEGCVSVGVVRVAIRRVDELRRLAAELARGRVVNGALFWRDPCATAVAGN